MATNEPGPKTLPVAPKATKGPLKDPGQVPALGRPGGGRAAAPLLAYVLHRYDWSESSLIVELFTRAQGRLAVVARGAKKPTSNFRPVLLPFQPLQALLGKAPTDDQGELRLLRGAEWVGGVSLLCPQALLPGYYVNELLMRLLARQDPHPRLFDAYADTLQALAQAAAADDDSATLRAFELVLLRELGWLADLDLATLTSEPLQPKARYALHADAGLVADARGLAGSHWLALQAALALVTSAVGLGPLRLACRASAAALRPQLRGLLHYHLGSTALRTREVWQGVQRLTDARQDTPIPAS
jgi:DNA repair protein RecO (recombination protein O)